MSDANPQIADFAWGTAELIQYKSLDGVPLQGVLIKSANYEPGKRYKPLFSSCHLCIVMNAEPSA